MRRAMALNASKPSRLKRIALQLCLALGFGQAALAEEGPRRFSLEEAVTFALEHHPALREQGATERASHDTVGVESAGYLPALEVSLQANRATGNVVHGSLFAMSGVPVTSGPPAATVFDSGRFGTAAGLALSWDALGLIRRIVVVDVALQDEARTSAGTDVRRLQVGFGVIDAFLTVLVRQEELRATVASVERAEVLTTTVRALAKQELRPGADLSRAEAELALASTERIRAEQAVAVAQVQLSEAMGIAGESVTALPGTLLADGGDLKGNVTAFHPAVRESKGAVRAADDRRRAADLLYLPRLDVVAALWARGSGLDRPGAGAGLLPDVPNWGAGLVLSWPALDFFADKARARVEAAHLDEARARQEQVEQAVKAQVEVARALLIGARRVADNSPVALRAALAGEEQARARYQSGLAPITEVAEAQRLLARAELEDAQARLGVKRAMLLMSRALGDLSPFLAEVRSPSAEVR